MSGEKHFTVDTDDLVVPNEGGVSVTTNLPTTTSASTTSLPNTINSKRHHSPTYLKGIGKRLPIDISKDLMDPVNIPSKFKLFQATSNSHNIFGCLQYTLFDGLRVSARSLDSRIKATYDPSSTKGNSKHHNHHRSTPDLKTSISWFETPRGTREGDIGVVIPNLYGYYNRGSVYQIGCSAGLRVHSFSRMIVSPFINPKFTYFGKYGWVKLDVPINKKSNRIVLKHNVFFQIGKNTFLSSLEVTSRIHDISRFFSDHYSSNKVLNSDSETNSFSRSTSVYNLQQQDDGKVLGIPFFEYKNKITPFVRGSRFFETIHYKIVHVSSATEFGIRRISKHVPSYQLEIGLKHQITNKFALQCLFSHAIGGASTVGLSFGLDI